MACTLWTMTYSKGTPPPFLKMVHVFYPVRPSFILHTFKPRSILCYLNPYGWTILCVIWFYISIWTSFCSIICSCSSFKSPLIRTSDVLGDVVGNSHCSGNTWTIIAFISGYTTLVYKFWLSLFSSLVK